MPSRALWLTAAACCRAGFSLHINAIEAGRFDPSLPLALRISALFQAPVEDIFWLAPE